MICTECARNAGGGRTKCYDEVTCAKLAKAEKRFQKKLKLSPAGLAEFRAAAQQTWQVIGGDCLQAMGIPDTSGKGIRRSHVIELVLDAGHIQSHNHKLSDEVKEMLDWTNPQHDYKTMIAALKVEFSFSEYGW